MKVLVEEREGQGLLALLGKIVMIETLNFNYTGKLVGVNDHDILLSEPKTVFDTGPYSAKDWADAQALPTKTLGIRLSSVQTYYEVQR
jgi:hypothetical protein